MPVLSKNGLVHHPPGPVPTRGWIKKGILVPGSWTRGEQKWIPEAGRHPWETWGIFDSYGFPAEWNDTNTTWYRTTFVISSVEPGRRNFLYFGGILLSLTSIADIDLNQYWNSLVALWKPKGNTLAFRWRNCQNQPKV